MLKVVCVVMMVSVVWVVSVLRVLSVVRLASVVRVKVDRQRRGRCKLNAKKTINDFAKRIELTMSILMPRP